MPLLDSETSAKMATLQRLDDAIAYRLERQNLPCQRCGPERKCAEHVHDELLLAGYQEQYAAALQDALAGMDHDDIARFMQRSDIPPTVGALSIVMMAALRELTADGPTVIEFDGRMVEIEQEGPAVVEYPLPDDTGSAADIEHR